MPKYKLKKIVSKRQIYRRVATELQSLSKIIPTVNVGLHNEVAIAKDDLELDLFQTENIPASEIESNDLVVMDDFFL